MSSINSWHTVLSNTLAFENANSVDHILYINSISTGLVIFFWLRLFIITVNFRWMLTISRPDLGDYLVIVYTGSFTLSQLCGLANSFTLPHQRPQSGHVYDKPTFSQQHNWHKMCEILMSDGICCTNDTGANLATELYSIAIPPHILKIQW